VTALVGAPVRKQDGDLYVTGRVTFANDISIPGVLHVAIVRSPHPHARIVSVDLDAASAHPGFVTALTGAEAAETVDPIPHALDPAGLGGNHADVRCLALHKVVYAGEPVVAVVAATQGDARAAASSVAVEYEQLPFVLDAEQALEAGAPVLYESWGTNVVIGGSVGPDDFDEIALNADCVLEGELRVHRGTSAPIEPRCYIAEWDRRDELLTFTGTTQNPHPLRSTLAAALKLPERQIRVVAPRQGGSFGLKMYAHPEEILVCVLARRLGRPVKWVEDRRECMLAGAREQTHRFQVAFDRDGRVRALRDRAISDHGAVAPGHGWGMGFVNALAIPTGYAIEHCRVQYTVVATNKAPWIGVRPFGKDIAALVSERVMELVAEATGLDPAEVRRRNFVPADAFPYVTSSGLELDSGNYAGLLDKALDRLGYAGVRAEQDAGRAEGRLLGIGIGFELTPEGGDIPGALVGGSDTTTVKMDPSGLVTVLTGVTSPGGGNDTGIAQVVADELGVELAAITVVQGDSSLCPYGFGNISSRSLVAGGGAAALAAGDIAERLRTVAASMLHAETSEIAIQGGMATVVGDSERAVPVPAVAHAVYTLGYILGAGTDPSLESTRTYRPSNIRHLPDEKGRIQPFSTFPNALHVAVVEVDPETGVVVLQRHVVAHDCGTIVNPMLVDGQVRGGVAMGAGAALGEELSFADDGSLVADGFKTYLMLRASDLPPIELEHQVTPSPFSFLGAKGAGEAGFAGALAAVFNAVNDAIRPLGARLDATPASAPNVLAAINNARRAG
jgi:aerobic carbon-monoxide dehydrogenase large subunit